MVTVPSFLEIITFCDNQKEVAVNVRKAIEEAIAAHYVINKHIPLTLKETNGKGRCIEQPIMIILKCFLIPCL